jgi:hypothetical protein
LKKIPHRNAAEFEIVHMGTIPGRKVCQGLEPVKSEWCRQYPCQICGHGVCAKIAKPVKTPEKRTHYQLTLFGADHPLLDELKALDLNATMPLEALQRLQQWRERLKAEKKKR